MTKKNKTMMYYWYSIFYVFIFIIFSCTVKNDNDIQEDSSSKYLEKKNNLHDSLQNKGVLEITFMGDFNDYVTVTLNDSIIFQDSILINESTGASDKSISLNINATKKYNLYFYISKKSRYKITILPIKHFLYIWKNGNVWKHELTDEPLELE